MGKYDVKKAFFGKNNSGIRKLAGIGSHLAMNAARSYMGGGGAYNVHKAFFGKNNAGVRKLAGIGSHLALEAARKRMSGSGAYHSKGKSRFGGGRASVSSSKYTASHMTVHHREYVYDVVALSPVSTNASAAPSPFASTLQSINTGNTTLFPWLSGISSNYSKYRFKSLAFYFKSLTSDAIASSNGVAASLGEVAMAIQYDEAGGPTQASYSNLGQMLNSEGAVSTKPSNNLMIGVECNRKDRPYQWYFTRSGLPPTGADYRLYDLGMIQIATQGVPLPAGANGIGGQVDVGQVWVEYEVEFETAVENPNASATSAMLEGTDTNVAGAQSYFTVSSAAQTAANLISNTLGLTTTDDGTTATVNFPVGAVGRYYVSYHNGSSTAPAAQLKYGGTVANIPDAVGTGVTFPGLFASNGGLNTLKATYVPTVEVPGAGGAYGKNGMIAFIIDLGNQATAVGSGPNSTGPGFAFKYANTQMPNTASIMPWQLRVHAIPIVTV